MKGERPIITFFATGFYTGYFPFAPATFSTLVLGVPVYLLTCRLSPIDYIIFLLFLTLLAVLLSDKAERIFQKQDCSFIVVDELVGFLITMFMVRPDLTTATLGFFLFRFFDIVKPPPAGFFNKRKKGGFDVVMDDVCAGAYANLILQGVVYFFLS